MTGNVSDLRLTAAKCCTPPMSLSAPAWALLCGKSNYCKSMTPAEKLWKRGSKGGLIGVFVSKETPITRQIFMRPETLGRQSTSSFAVEDHFREQPG